VTIFKGKGGKGSDEQPEMSIADALNALRAGGKQWRAWARAEEAAEVIEAGMQVQAEREQTVRQLGEQLESLQGEIQSAQRVVTDAKASAEQTGVEAKAKADALLAAAERDASELTRKARRNLKAMEDSLLEAETKLRAANEQIAVKAGELVAAEAVIAKAEAVRAALT
jgi:hypothetical protein